MNTKRSSDFAVSNSRRLKAVLNDYCEFKKYVLPLCAAETPISEYVRKYLTSEIHEKYAMGGVLSDVSGNFIGSDYVLNIHRIIIDLCRGLFGATYSDPRPTTGLGAVTNLLMTISSPGQKILLQTSESGGHASMLSVCRRLSLEVIELPYDFLRFNISTRKTQELVRENNIDFILYAPSDIIYTPNFTELNLSESTTVIYDATQTLGLIASKCLRNPLLDHPKMVIVGGTHKTLPGPSSGLIMTNNDKIIEIIDSELNPKFLRHSQPHHMAALAATLIEQSAIGITYGQRIQSFTKVLSDLLTEIGIEVLQYEDLHSQTHQIFIKVPFTELDTIYRRFARIGVTLNKKEKKLFKGSGIRIGVQELARYTWELNDLPKVAELIYEVVWGTGKEKTLRQHVTKMAKKNEFHPNLLLSSDITLIDS